MTAKQDGLRRWLTTMAQALLEWWNADESALDREDYER